MKYNNEQIIFEIPPLSSEWSFNAKLYHLKQENTFYISNELLLIEAKEICNFYIFNTNIGDINKFDVICPVMNQDCNKEYSVFYLVLKPILQRFCEDRMIELKLSFTYE